MSASAATRHTGNHPGNDGGNPAFFTEQSAHEWNCPDQRDWFLIRVEAVRTAKIAYGNDPHQTLPADQRLWLQLFGAESAFPSCSFIG
ncbi:MAG: hypothetical protein WKF77_09520 [Planctomycetaceae bacterium]